VSAGKPVRQLVTVAMNLLILLAIMLVVRIVVLFFGTLAAQGWAQAFVTISDYLVIPFGIEQIKTPYGGVLDVDAALTVATFIVAEWALSVARNRA
jgi:hypothetical protein